MERAAPGELAPALGSAEDDREAALRCGDALERFVGSLVVPVGVRPVVARSWVRSSAAGVDHDGHRLPPLRLPYDELHDYRSDHPLAPLLPMFDELLGQSAREGRHLFAVTDAAGTLLWVRGHPEVVVAAERMNFVEGAGWSEQLAGTNAPGTALATGRPVQIFATEHYSSAVHRWSCAAAPIRDPVDGRVLGVVDLTGGAGIAGSPALALVRAAARLAEGELAGGAVRRAGVGLTALGRDSALLEVHGRTLRLTPRHSELVVALALAPDGISGERLAVQLSRHELRSSTIRAELTRLRAVLGPALLGSRPYALQCPVNADFLRVRDRLAEGDLPAALAAYAGPLLTASDAPLIAEYRELLEQQLRGALLAARDPVLLRRWVNAPWAVDDAIAWRALADALPRGSAQRAAAAARARALAGTVAAVRPVAPVHQRAAALSRRVGS